MAIELYYLYLIYRDLRIFYNFEDSFWIGIYKPIIEDLIYDLRHNIVQIDLDQIFVYRNVFYRKNKNVCDPNDRCYILAVYLDYKTIFIYIIFDTILFQLAGRNEVDRG